MHIGFVGGIERGESHYQALAARAGHVVEFHYGHVGGRGSPALESLIERSDVVVVLTDVNSHGAVQLARRLVRRSGVRLLLLRRCGLARFGELVASLPSNQYETAAKGI